VLPQNVEQRGIDMNFGRVFETHETLPQYLKQKTMSSCERAASGDLAAADARILWLGNQRSRQPES
jgi:hypothetical protein